MSARTGIAWCDSTVNFWWGCRPVSCGCDNCYARRDAKRFGMPDWAQRRKMINAVRMAKRLNRKPWVCDWCGNASRENPSEHGCGWCNQHLCSGHEFHRRRIMSLSMGDWLDTGVPVEWLAEMLDTIRQCSDVTWILPTKRPEWFHSRMTAVTEHHVDRSDMVDWLSDWRCGKAPPNIILLAYVESQEQADKRIPELLRIPAAVRGLSLEPLLGPVHIPELRLRNWTKENELGWLVIGGESGPKARPCNVAWIRSLAQQGKAAGVPVFVKQLGGNPCSSELTSDEFAPYMGKLNLNHPKGGDPSEWPSDLRVREWPNN